ncbi:MAG: GNAT family N-acetyltransferase [Pseudomonadota bacterium]
MAFIEVARLALGSTLHGINVRTRDEHDRSFLSDLYTSTRIEELQQVDWPEQQKRAFLHDQFTLQHEHYLKHYPRASWLVIERDGVAIGRLYEETTGSEVRLMDISLLPDCRNQGIGSTLMKMVLDYADELNLPVGLHVESFNPALKLYMRLGFTTMETRGIYFFMQRNKLS